MKCDVCRVDFEKDDELAKHLEDEINEAADMYILYSAYRIGMMSDEAKSKIASETTP